MTLDQSGGHEPVEAPGETTRRQQEPVGELAHAHPTVLFFRQLDEDSVVGHRHALAGLELGVEPGQQSCVGAQQRTPCVHLDLVEPACATCRGHNPSVPE